MSKKNTKRALLSSVLALVLCFAMLTGTTFAWFTDSVTSGKNQIVAGNLDIELEYLLNGVWTKVDANTNVFKEDTLWEPGHTEVVYLRVSNLGTLALKYELGINVASEITSTSIEGTELRLSEHIVYDVVEGVTEAYKDRAAARDAAKNDGNFAPVSLAIDYMKAGTMKANDAPQYVALVVYMPEDVTNEANYDKANGAPAPTINLGINLLATQMVHENDSFGNTYDEAATFWTGNAVTPEEFEESVDTATKTISIWSASELAYWAANANDYRGYTINIMNNIDLSGYTWVPANLWNPEKALPSINGNGHTISNMTVNGGAQAGFIGTVSGTGAMTISDLAFENADVTTSGSHAAVVIGYQYGKVTLDNVTVNNSSAKTSASKGINIAALVGLSLQNEGATLTVTDCTVTNNTIAGYHTVGTIVGKTTLPDSSASFTLSNTTITGNNVSYTATAGVGAHEVGAGGGGYSSVNYSGDNNTIENNYISALVTTSEQFAAAIAHGGNIVLGADVEVGTVSTTSMKGAVYTGTEPLNIDGNGYTITMAGSLDSGHDWAAEYYPGICAFNAEVTIKNAKIVNNKISTNGTTDSADRDEVYTTVRGAVVNFEKVDFIGGVLVKENTNFKNCTFTVTDAKHYALFHDHQYGSASSTTVLDNCQFTATGSYGTIKVADDNGKDQYLTVKDCTFNANATGKSYIINAGDQTHITYEGTNTCIGSITTMEG